MSRTKWTEEDIERLKRLYGTMPSSELMEQHFPNKPIRSLKWQVEKWRLGQRKEWEDDDLELLNVLVQCNVPNSALSQIFKRSPQAVAVKLSQLGLTRHRRGSHVDEKQIKFREQYNQLSANVVGGIAEIRCTQVMLERGYHVFYPFQNNHRVDLLAVIDRIPVRIQVKSAIYDAKTKRYRLPMSGKTSVSSEGGRVIKRRGYDSRTTDFLLAVCPGVESIYVIPSSVTAEHKYANFYPKRRQMIIEGKSFDEYENAFDLIEDFAKRRAAQGYEDASQEPNFDTISVTRRNWTKEDDQLLSLLVKREVGPQAIARILGRTLAAVQSRKARLGTQVQDVRYVPEYASRFAEIAASIDTKVIGSACEAVTFATLALNGVNLFIPAVPNLASDAVALVGRALVTLQIKLAQYEESGDVFRCELGRKTHMRGREPYVTRDIDYFIVNCALGDDLYVIPERVAQKTRHISLFPHRERKSEKGGFEFEGYRNWYQPLIDRSAPGIWR